MTSILIFFSILFGVDSASAQTSLELSIQKLQGGRSLSFMLASDSLSACEIALYGASSLKKLNSGKGKVLFETTGAGSSLELTAKKLPRLEGMGNVPVFFEAVLNCSGVEQRSEIITIKLRRFINGTVESVKNFLGQLKKKITPVSANIAPAFPKLSFNAPLDLQNAGDGSNRLFVVEQAGYIRVFQNSASTASSSEFLDLHELTEHGGEQGLLGLAFHPNYENNGYFFVNYTDNDGNTQVVRYKVSADPNRADPTSALPILSVNQPFSNHNGGGLAFGPDGYLYIGLGDGGSGGDPEENGEDLETLLGKMLRIDVDGTSGPLNYRIPVDNPFVGNSIGARMEIFAWGLRNPWRYSFDPATGLLWAGDVGQNKIEEIDIIRSGKNYGWDIMEGSLCHEPESGCDKGGLEAPVAEYGRDLGSSVTGGHVYRGNAVPRLLGQYIYGDFVSGRVFYIPANASTPAQELIDTELNISSFGVDEAKELYIVSYSGTIHKFVP